MFWPYNNVFQACVLRFAGVLQYNVPGYFVVNMGLPVVLKKKRSIDSLHVSENSPPFSLRLFTASLRWQMMLSCVYQ